MLASHQSGVGRMKPSISFRLKLLIILTGLAAYGTCRYFAARGEDGRAQDRPHFVYGDYQRRRKLPPEALNRSVGEAWASSLDPLEGERTG